jgi:hypothetical protein
MNTLSFFAHAGQQHETVAEAVAHTGQDPVVLWIVLLLVPVVIAFFAHNIFKLKLFNTLLWISFFLIAYSVYSYQDPGMHTVLALSGGFGIVFTTAILGLASNS